MTIPAIASTINAVTVYRSGAVVTRVAEVERGDGGYPSLLRIPNLPLCLDDGSIGIRLGGDGDLPLATDVKVSLEVGELDEGLAPPDDEELWAARAEVARQESEVARIERENDRLKKLAPSSRPKGEEGKPPAPVETAARIAALEFRESRTRQLIEARTQAQKSLDEARRQMDELEERERRATTARQTREHELRKTAVIRLAKRQAEASRLRLELDYTVPGARWAPAYRLDLNEELTGGKLAMRAIVRQKTGEDWQNASFTLSTADMHCWTELPELQSIRIGRAQRQTPRIGWRPTPIGWKELYADYDRAFREEAPPPKAIPQPAAPPTPGEAALHGTVMPPPVASLQVEDTHPGTAPVETAMEDALGALPVEAPGASPPAPRSAPAWRAAEATLSRVEKFKRVRKPRVVSYGERTPELGAPHQPLRYSSLELPPPNSSRRGLPTPQDERTTYLEVLLAQQITVEVDVLSVMHASVKNAQACGRDAAPPSHCFPMSHDGFDSSYDVDARVDIPSDGTFHSLLVTERAVSADPMYVAVPRETQEAFVVVELENPLDGQLLPGPVDVYVSDTFRLTTRMDPTPQRGQVRLGLGVEPSIKVARNASYGEETAGLIRGALELVHGISIELENQLERPVNLEVRERIPVIPEKEDDIKVEVRQSQPPWEAYDPDDYPLKGGYRWKVEVPSREKRSLVAEYKIHISGKHQLRGGNRRED